MTLGRKTRAVAAALMAFVCCCVAEATTPAPVLASASVLEMRTDDAETVTWHLTADNLSTLNESKILEATGQVALRRGNEFFKADYARYYSTTNWVYLKGNVEVFTGTETIRAEEAEFDLRSRTGWMQKGEIFMEGPHIYFTGERVTKKWGDYYTFEKAKVTSCPPDGEAWSMNAEQAVVEIDGYAQLFGATFDVADTSLAYSPYMLLPAKRTRQTGLLMPEYGMSTRRGVYYNQPFYWAVDDRRDVTINEYWMEKRGFMHGVEYRSREASDTAMWMRFDWLDDLTTVKNDADDPIAKDGLVRTNSERFWLRGMTEGRLGDPDWRYKLDLDYVSDQNFLREFNSGMSGFGKSRSQLFELFGRDIRELDRNRISQGMVYREWDRATVALSARYEQDPSLGHGNKNYSADTTVQRLPQLDVFLHKGRAFEEMPLEIEAEAQTVYFHRRNGTQGGRTEIAPRVTLPMNSRYGSVIASMGWRQTMYNTERAKGLDGEPAPTGDYRSLPDYNVAAFTEVGRVWDLEDGALDPATEEVGTRHWKSVYHRVQPRIEYRNIANVDQDRNPYYDDSDRIGPRSELVYSVTNILTRKRGTVVPARDPDSEEEYQKVAYDYLDVIRWRLESGYDLREMDRNDDLEDYPRRPFMDMISDLRFGVFDWLGLYTRSYWSPYLGDFTRHDQGVTFTSQRWGYISTGYSYRPKLDEYNRKRTTTRNLATLTAAVNMWGPWSAAGHMYYDFVRQEGYERAFDLIYSNPCYKFILRYSYDVYDEGIEFLVELPGLTD